MPKYQDTFKLDLNDINLIETALYEFMSQKLQDSYVRNGQSLQSAPPQVRSIQALLGKLHNQKVFYGQVNPVYGAFIAVATFLIQMLVSRLWLNKFHFGPIEWLWRSLTYGRLQVMRRL